MQTKKESTGVASVTGVGETRDHILQLLLKYGPITASDLGDRLNLSAAGIRRHLDNLVSEELAECDESRKRAGRGRPAKYFRLTNRGRDYFGHNYDSLAASALNALREVGGAEAVRRFAQKRVEDVVKSIPPAEDSEESITLTTQKLAEAFDRNGYAVTITKAGQGIQLCQHHCPVASVAAEHPEICEAEHKVIASKVGLHIQPLASIVGGHGICTTNIPLTAIDKKPEERSQS